MFSHNQPGSSPQSSNDTLSLLSPLSVPSLALPSLPEVVGNRGLCTRHDGSQRGTPRTRRHDR